MRTAVLLVAVFALLGGLVWLLTASREEGPAPRITALVESERPPDSREGEAAPPSSTVREESEEPQKRLEPAAGGQPLRERAVLVRLAGSRQPVAGAEVRWIELDGLETAELVAMRATLESQGAWIRRSGRYGRTDASGRLGLRSASVALLAVARHEGMAGFSSYFRRRNEILVIELQRDRAVAVRVLDAGGAPAPGVQVAVYKAGRRGWDRMVRGRSDPRGIWRLEHALQALDSSGKGGERAVGFDFPLAPFPLERFELAALPEAPLTLHLPPTGSLKVELFGPAGDPAPDGSWVDIRQLGVEEGEVVPRLVLRTERGAVRISHLGLGLELDLRAHLSERGARTLERRIFGPTAAGEEVLVQLRLEPPFPVIVARLLDPDGKPISSASLSSSLRRSGGGRFGSRGSRTRTDREGRVRFVLDEPWSSGERRSLELRRSQPEMRIEIDLARVFPPGETDLGDLMMAPRTLLASGLVVDERGRPVPGAAVSARTESHYAWGETIWTDHCSGASDDEGRFTLRGRLPRERMQLFARKEGCYCASKPIVEVGTTGVTLRLDAATALRGRVLLDRDIPPAALLVRVLEADGERHEAKLDRKGNFQLRELRPGQVSVELRTRDDWPAKSVLQIGELLTTMAGAAPDPRLAEIDLRGRLRYLSLRLVDVEGEAVQAGALELHGGGSGVLASAITRSRKGGRVDPRLLDRASDYRVLVPGFRPARAADVAEEQVLELVRGPALHLRWAGEGELPSQPRSLHITLEPASESGRKIPTGRSPKVALRPDEPVRLHVPVPGRYRVHWQLHRTEGAGTMVTSLELDPPLVLTVDDRPGDQTFDLVLPRSALEAADREK